VASAQGQGTSSSSSTSNISAQGDESVTLEEFVVTGVRASLINAQELKQNAPQFVDSIVAVDIGKFPDNTVAEALQRVPGIQVSRTLGEVSSVVIRGLPNIATTLNGHEAFTGTGRGVALQDLPAELIAGLDVYKSNSPDQTEGGIAGLIDVRLRKPLDFKGFAMAGGARGIYNDNSEKNGYTASGLVSNRWKFSNGGEFGALAAASYQRSRVQDAIMFNFLYQPLATSVVPGQTEIQVPNTDGAQVNPADRKRSAFNLSLQWKPTSNLEFYSDTLFTTYRNKHAVHFFIGLPRAGAIQSAELYPGTNVPKSVTSLNNFQLTSTQAFNDKTDTYQTAFGGKWTLDDLKLTAEYVYNWSTVKHRAVIVDTQFTPQGTFVFDFNPENSSDVKVNGADVTDANNYALWGLFDNHDYATSYQHELRTDLEYKIRSGFLTKFQGGLRFTDRNARSRATAQNDIAPAAGRGVTRTASIPGFGSKAPDSKADFSSANWYGGNADFLRDHVEIIRPLFGQPVSDPNFITGNAFSDKEKTAALYGQVTYHATLGTLPLDGVAGARVVKTKENVQGFNPNGTPLDADKDDTQVLPVLNGRLGLAENLLLRASVGRSITRPNFADLNPVTALFSPTTTGGSRGTGSGGNPELGSVKSTNYDLSLEYYLNKSSYVALTGFYRNINGYVQTFASVENFNGVEYIVTRPRNSGKGHLDGVELSYQQFLDFLPSPLNGFGIQANFTYIEGNQDVADPSPTAPVGSRLRQAYAQVSKYNYNLVGIYEKGPFSARLAYNWRGSYVDSFDGPNDPGSPLRIITVKARGQLDFSASYEFRKGLSVTFDITNLLDAKYHDYFGPDAHLFPRDTRIYDRSFALGIRYTY
jgi:TonB-dependent receptor